jgi:hypothetical protein
MTNETYISILSILFIIFGLIITYYGFKLILPLRSHL